MYVTHPCFVSLPLSDTSIILSPSIAGDGKEFICEISSKSKDQKIKRSKRFVSSFYLLIAFDLYPLTHCNAKLSQLYIIARKFDHNYISKLCLIWFVLLNKIMKVCCISFQGVVNIGANYCTQQWQWWWWSNKRAKFQKVFLLKMQIYKHLKGMFGAVGLLVSL